MVWWVFAAQAAMAVGSSLQKADAAKQQAKIAKRVAENERARGRWNAWQIRLRARQLVGAQRAGSAGQGVDVSTGSAAALQAETGYLAELDVSQALHNSAMAAWGFQTQSSALDDQSKLLKRQALFKAAEGGAKTFSAFGAANPPPSGLQAGFLTPPGFGG